MSLRKFLSWLPLACWIAAIPFAALAQSDSYPMRPVKLIVPFPAGGSADFVSRMISERLSTLWKQPVIVENKPGGGTTIGLNAIAKAAPDGYTIGMNSISHIIQPAVRTTLPYDTLEDFEFITKVMEAPFVLTVNARLPIMNLKDLVAYANSNPGVLNFASFGVGSAGHIFFEILAQHTGIKAVHIPYKGTSEATAAQLAGDVALMFDLAMSPLPHIKQGKLRALLVTTSQRFRELPDTPTSREVGIPELEMPTWFGIVAPRGIPPAILNKLNASIAQVMQSPDLISTLEKQGMSSVPNSSEEFRAFAVRSVRQIRDAATAGNIPKVDK